MAAACGVRFEGTAFWVRHRHREYGPFDYEWARDLGGIELLYQQEKFGEFCSADALSADLREFRLPMRVVEVTSVVSGSVIFGLLNGLSDIEKTAALKHHLQQNGLDRFADNIQGRDES